MLRVHEAVTELEDARPRYRERTSFGVTTGAAESLATAQPPFRNHPIPALPYWCACGMGT
ncbi:hypothetical protein ZHAS_00011391 [Anopheles sinensis]|uniref:Uncharacterized protein n=1 Tax=Anopheles sinensis TaxID=74873 RepID=A0A084W0C1_ANOSI|nr:hypothetical protein ZHAS_00011391 [Anopheles sinensis]